MSVRHVITAVLWGAVFACASSPAVQTRTTADVTPRRDSTVSRSHAANRDSAAARATPRDTLAKRDTSTVPVTPRDAVAPSYADSLMRGGVTQHGRVDASRLHASAQLYSLTLRADTGARPLGVVEHTVSEGSHAGLTSWVFATTGSRGGIMVAESLWVARADLAAQHWTSTVGPSRLSAEFTHDTAYIAVTTPMGRRSIAAYSPPGVLVNEPMTDAVLGLLPLAVGYEDSVFVLVVDLGGSAAAPARLTTEREERVTVPAGTFDAFVVSLELERGGARYWIDKTSRVVLRSEQTVPELGGAVLRRELLRVN
jgi:hypothetical protein